jgi:hypothetical protein
MTAAERISVRRAMITEKVFAITDMATLDLLFEILSTVQGPELLDAVHAILGSASVPSDWYERMSNEDKESIRLSQANLAVGNVHDHDALMHELRSWKKK